MAAASAVSMKVDGDDEIANPTSQQPHSTQKNKPICVIVLGMAGSGKTTFVQVHGILIIMVYWVIFV